MMQVRRHRVDVDSEAFERPGIEAAVLRKFDKVQEEFDGHLANFEAILDRYVEEFGNNRQARRIAAKARKKVERARTFISKVKKRKLAGLAGVTVEGAAQLEAEAKAQLADLAGGIK